MLNFHRLRVKLPKKKKKKKITNSNEKVVKYRLLLQIFPVIEQLWNCYSYLLFGSKTIPLMVKMLILSLKRLTWHSVQGYHRWKNRTKQAITTLKLGHKMIYFEGICTDMENIIVFHSSNTITLFSSRKLVLWTMEVKTDVWTKQYSFVLIHYSTNTAAVSITFHHQYTPHISTFLPVHQFWMPIEARQYYLNSQTTTKAKNRQR